MASINLWAEDEWLHLTYRVRIGGGDWEDVAEVVHVVRVACRFGGTRPYFICPGVINGIACDRRIVKLYLAGRCAGIAAASRTPAGARAHVTVQGVSAHWAAPAACEVGYRGDRCSRL